MLSFNGETKVIKLDIGVREITAQELYSRWKDWVAEDNAGFSPAFRTVGGDPLTGDLSAPVYYFLLNGWRVEPSSEDHLLDVSINLYGEGGADPFKTPSGDFTIRISNRTSDAQVITQTSSSAGLSAQQAEEIKSIYLAILGGRTQDLETGEIVIYEEDNTTPRHTLQAYKDGVEASLIGSDAILPKE